MKVGYKILFVLFLLGVLVVGGCVKREIPPEKYCEKDDDCLTSCGTKIGKGSCYNKNFFDFDENGMLRTPIDNTCCICDDYIECNYCICRNNYCTVKKGDC